ncbi:MAG: aminotransferase class IV [Chloroflexi bacterium]|nr:aminotransferase class IV [Chloroflexota bacterium]
MGKPERVAYFNGQIVPESQVLISFRDRSFKYGDGVFDMTRTFNGHIFKLQEHLERLYRSLKYVGIDPGLSIEQMTQISKDVVERNLALLGPGEDFWVGQRVTRGVDVVGGDFWENSGPTVIVECTPLPLKARATLYRDGIDVVFPSVQRTPPESLSPNVKSHNYLNVIMADLEVRNANPKAWALLLDTRGFLAEGMGSNVFLVKDGVLYTPKEQYVLAGVSRQTVIELAEQLKLKLVEDDLTPYNAYTADEAFITSTSFCICPVHSFNGKVVGDGRVPGPLTKKLTDAYTDLVDCDFVEQYLRHLA